MRRKTYFTILTCLLCLLSLPSLAQSLTHLEYWFDDNFSNRRAVSLNGTDYEVDTEISTQGLKNGVHTLWYRVRRSDKMYSPISHSTFFKWQYSEGMKLEYWIDDDYEHAQTFDGRLASDGKDYIFVNDLDLGDITPGHHRIYFHAVTSDNESATAVSSMPIIVKSKYNVENPEELKVTEYAYWIDNEEPTVVSVAQPKNIINQPLTLDTRKLSDGRHTLHVQFGNSADIWNAPYDTIFNKTHVNDPVIAANATVENGVVTLKYTAVPFGQRYIVVRQYPSGTKRKVDDLKSTEYPAALQATDTPAPGTYTYYIEGIYTDADGQTQKVRSGDMAVTVENAASTVGKGTIHGVLLHDGERFTNPLFHDYVVNINGVRASVTDYYFRQENYGNFVIGDIPYGTELTIGIWSNDYLFQDTKVIVNENTADKSYKFNGTSDGEGEQLNDEAYDLVLTDKVHITPDAWEIPVHNKYRFTPWSGNIIVKAISKELWDVYNKEATEGISWLYFLYHTDAKFDDGPNYKTCANAHVQLDKNEYKTLALDIIDLPSGEYEDYYICVFSKRDDTDQLKMLGDGERQTLKFDPTDCYVANDDFRSYIQDYKTILSYIKLMSKWGDPFALEVNTFGNKFDEIIDNLGNGTYNQEGLEKDIIVNSSHVAGMLLNSFLKDIHKTVKQTAKATKETLKPTECIREVYETLENFYQANQVDDNLKFFETAKQVMKLCSNLKSRGYKFFPALEVYKSYLEVGEAMVKAIDRISASIHGDMVYDKLISGKALFKIKVRKYTTNGSTQYFNPYDVWKQIKEVKINIATEQPGVKPESKSLKEDFNEGHTITIKDVVFEDVGSNIVEYPEAWMTIPWKNNRVTHVPLFDEHFVKKEHFSNYDLKKEDIPLIMTVELQSESYLSLERMANKLTIIKQ